MRRLRLFVKGNVDVHDSLHSCRVGGALLWNGINAALREAGLGVTVRIRHETMTRSDAVLASDGTPPEGLAARVADHDLPLGAYPLASQFSRAVFEDPADAVVLSIQSDVMMGLRRHVRDGYLFFPANFERWPSQDVAWLASECPLAPPLTAAASMANLRAIITEIRRDRPTPILIYNMSSIIPGETVHCLEGLEETLSERIKRFNLGLIDLSRETGISIVDVDRVLAESGALTLKRDTIHLTAQGYRLIAFEVSRILNDLGLCEPLPA